MFIGDALSINGLEIHQYLTSLLKKKKTSKSSRLRIQRRKKPHSPSFKIHLYKCENLVDYSEMIKLAFTCF